MCCGKGCEQAEQARLALLAAFQDPKTRGRAVYASSTLAGMIADSRAAAAEWDATMACADGASTADEYLACDRRG